MDNEPVPVVMGRERFEELVAEALDEVPAELLELMDNVVVLVEDDPDGDDKNLLGLYEGYALTTRGWDYAGVLPDRITIYRNPTLRDLRLRGRRGGRGRHHRRARDRPSLRHRRRSAARPGLGLTG